MKGVGGGLGSLGALDLCMDWAGYLSLLGGSVDIGLRYLDLDICLDL